MQIPIVNEDDVVIGTKERTQLDYSTDIFRSASLWITNTGGEILVAQRTLDKAIYPGKWAEAVGGTVEGHDSYEQTIIREAEEELGLKNIAATIGPKQFVDDTAKYFVQWYTAIVDLPIESFVLQTEEVQAVAWVSISQLRRELQVNPDKYIPEMDEIVHLFR